MRIRRIIFFWVLIFNSILQVNPQSVMAQKAIGYAREANKIILQYTLMISEIKAQEPTPLLRIFGDGTVKIHFPMYMKRAGDYYLKLSEQELEALVSFLDENGLFDFDAPKIRQLKNEKLRELHAESIKNDLESVLVKTLDADTSIFIYNVEQYVTDHNGSSRVMPRRAEIAWRGLKTDANRFSDIKALTGLAAIEEKLKNIIEREDLIKIKD
jgi:hypothetical protein